NRNGRNGIDRRPGLRHEPSAWRYVGSVADTGRARDRSAAVAAGASAELRRVGLDCGQPGFTGRYCRTARPTAVAGTARAGTTAPGAAGIDPLRERVLSLRQ